MAGKTYLLAYPRSGSSIARLLISFLSKMRPAQASGGVEQSLDDLLREFGVEYEGEFFKYHTRVDPPFTMPLDAQDTLIYLRRDPLEHLVSWAFSQVHLKSANIEGVSKAELAGQIIRPPHPKLVKNVEGFYGNEGCFHGHTGKKVCIQYENMLRSPEYLIGRLRTIVEVDKEAALRYRKEFNKLKQRMMEIKSGPGDSIRVNTFGDADYWRKTLLEDDIERFEAYLESKKP